MLGQTDDGQGMQALVVEIGGTTQRPDGSCFHITWPVEEGRKPEEANAAIAEHGWQLFDPPVPVRLEPTRLA